MRRGLFALLVLTQVAVWHPAGAVELDASTCSSAGRKAELRFGIPPGLLDAIGRVESGRGREGSPWPWTVSAGGIGTFFKGRTDAATQIARLQTRGIRMIDVGCFQVDLFWHPGAFATIDEALDPTRNAEEAARFLADLYRQTSDWPSAVARYHSSNPMLGIAYQNRVLRGAPLSSAPSVAAGRDPFVIALLVPVAVQARRLPHIVRATPQ